MTLKQQGFIIVYTDGSVEWVPTVGWIGGYRCFEPSERWEYCSFLPLRLRQSVNRAELQAVTDVVKKYKHQPQSVAVATDSADVHDGVQSKALQWKALRWITTHGPVVNLDLWEEVLDIILSSSCTFKWIKVPSHIDIEGKERADKLAESGRSISPSYLTVRRAVQNPITPPPPLPREDAPGGHSRPQHPHGSHSAGSPRRCHTDASSP